MNDRAFALAFWPDTKGFTPKALSSLIATEDAAVESPEGFAETSVAGRGFFALEQMLYEPNFADQGSATFRCALIQAITTDIASNARAINADWGGYATALTQPGDDSPYRSDDEAMQELYKALVTGLEFTGDTRLGRPMGISGLPKTAKGPAFSTAAGLLIYPQVAASEYADRSSRTANLIANSNGGSFSRVTRWLKESF